MPQHMKEKCLILLLQSRSGYITCWGDTLEFDQKSLKALLTQTIQTSAQHKWLTKLLGFDYEIIYTPGRTNVVANALSRKHHAAELLVNTTSSKIPSLIDHLKSFYSSDPIGVALLQKYQATIDLASKFSVHNGLVYYQGRLFIPAECDLREKLLTEFHSSPIGDHSGGRATIARLTTSFHGHSWLKK